MDILCWSMRCLLVRGRGHRSGTTKRSGWAPPKRGLLVVARRRLLGCHALLLQVRGDWAWCKALFGFKGWASKEICWRCKANCSDIPWTDTSSAAAWRTSRYRTSDLLARQTEQGISVNPLFSSRPSSFASMCCTRWTWARRRTRLEMCFSIWSQARVGHMLFSISRMCVCACVFVCVRLCFACTSSCVVSPLQAVGFVRTQSRSGRIAELWNRIKLRYKTFHTQSWLQSLTLGDDPRRPEASQAACEGCGDPPLGALLFRTGDGLLQAPAVSSRAHCQWTLRAAVRFVHDHVCGAVRQVLHAPGGLANFATSRRLCPRRPPTTRCGR